MSDAHILKRAQSSSLLDTRIQSNRSAQSVDLGDWIFDHLDIAPTMHILEICAGTGAQSKRFLEKIPEGALTAVDISDESLNSLRRQVADKDHQRLTTVVADMDKLGDELPKLVQPSFDLVFCAYGLYYSQKPDAVLDTVKTWLKPAGRIVIVGPFGPNNRPLFDLLTRCGVSISDYVRYTSQDFMGRAVTPWAGEHFMQTQTHTVCNTVAWSDAEAVMNYWRNTTFYAAECESAVDKALNEHFQAHDTFKNEKWIQIIEMIDAR